jgi:hypothetical protein
LPSGQFCIDAADAKRLTGLNRARHLRKVALAQKRAPKRIVGLRAPRHRFDVTVETVTFKLAPVLAG